MSHTVRIASPLRSYTKGAAQVPAEGATLRAVLSDLDRRYPGMRFRMIDEQDRIRPHIRFFVGQHEVRNMAQVVQPADEIHIICALSGG